VVESSRTSGSSPPNAATELANTKARRPGAAPRRVEHRAHAAEVHAHTEVEVGLGRARDHGGEVEDRVGVRGDGARGEMGIGDVAGERLQPGVPSANRGRPGRRAPVA